jgi:hypothetical protein
MVQGLQHNSLVAGKTSALRMFVDAAALATADHVEAIVLRPDGSKDILSWAKTEYVVVSQSIGGPSIVVRIAGSTLRWIGTYTVRARILTANGAEIANYVLNDVGLLPTKDLRVMVSRLWSGTPTKPGELEAAHAAMHRLASVFPLRDGVSTLDGDYSAGLRYNLDNNPTEHDANLGPLWDQYLNRPRNVDSIDVAITYRFPNDGEDAGASTKPPYKSLKWSLIVWKSPFAGVFCQETGHNFGLEPPEDSHHDPGEQGGGRSTLEM